MTASDEYTAWSTPAGRRCRSGSCVERIEGLDEEPPPIGERDDRTQLTIPDRARHDRAGPFVDRAPNRRGSGRRNLMDSVRPLHEQPEAGRAERYSSELHGDALTVQIERERETVRRGAQLEPLERDAREPQPLRRGPLERRGRSVGREGGERDDDHR
jgi:hypothetical protein